MTLPVRFFCSTQAVQGSAIHMGRPLTSKRMSTASAWRVAMATIVPFQRQCRSSPLQRSVTWKSSYMPLSVPFRASRQGGQAGGRVSVDCCSNRADKLVGLQWHHSLPFGPACKSNQPAKDKKDPVDTQTRHALKKDKFAQAAASSASWVGEHQAAAVRWGIGIGIVVVLAIGGLIFWNVRSSAANAALGAALDVYTTPLAIPGAPR